MGKLEPNVHVDQELLAQARAAGLSVEQVAEAALRAAVAKADPAAVDARAAKWAAENAEAIKAHRARIEKYGLFGEDFRTW
jgi:antitoxin CcdA